MSEVFLLPGKFAVMAGPGIIRTVLGSCVAVVLCDHSTGIGGMNHYLLPSALPGRGDERLRYGDQAIPALISDMLDKGADHGQLQAQIFGGGAVVSSLTSAFTIGTSNIAAAKAQLARWNVPIVRESVGGTLGRKIVFRIPIFDVEVQYISARS